MAQAVVVAKVNEQAATAEAARDSTKLQARGWCFTINNPRSKTLFPDGLPESIKYIVYQFEIGKEGTPHLQGFLYFVKPKRMAAIKKIAYKNSEDASVTPFAGAHLEVAKGSPQQNKDYCTKAETRKEGPWELGEFPKGSGERTDLAAAAQMLKDGKSLKELAESMPELFIRNWRGLEQFNAKINPAKKRTVKVTCIQGPAGICKSSWVYSLGDVKQASITKDGQLWIPNYAGEKRLLLDDFTGQLPYNLFNRICDGWAFDAPTKGGFVAAEWTEVYICTNIEPTEWYPAHVGVNNDFVDAVYRRIGYGKWSGHSERYRYFKLESLKELKDWAVVMGHPLPDEDGAPPKIAAAAAAPMDEDSLLPDAQDPADDVPPRSTTPTQVCSPHESPKLKRRMAQAPIIVDD